jgi:hypothetical protein
VKRIATLLVQIAAFAGVVATFVVPAWAVRSQFGLSEPWPILAGLGGIGLALFSLFRWLLRIQKKERTVLSTNNHPLFGVVRHLKNHWEASTPVMNAGPSVEIWGDSLTPSKLEASTFAAIRERYPALLTQALLEINEFLLPLEISLSEAELHLEGVQLDGEEFGSFDLTFDVPAHEKKIPWGLTVRFSDFTVDAIDDNH